METKCQFFVQINKNKCLSLCDPFRPDPPKFPKTSTRPVSQPDPWPTLDNTFAMVLLIAETYSFAVGTKSLSVPVQKISTFGFRRAIRQVSASFIATYAVTLYCLSAVPKKNKRNTVETAGGNCLLT